MPERSTFDLFGEGRHRYTFESRCVESNRLRLEDGTQKLFLNTEGIAEDVKEPLRIFLEYLKDGREQDEYTEISEKRYDDLARIAEDPAYRNELYRQYGITG